MDDTAAKIMVYDEYCPACRQYTGWFVKQGVLKAENRWTMEQLHASDLITAVNPERYRNEIPLIDLAGGSTLYGLDAFLFLMQKRFPVLRWIKRIQPIYKIAWAVYYFISYNRRIIMPVECDTTCNDPAKNLTQNVAFIVVALLGAIAVSLGFGQALDVGLSYWEQPALGPFILVVVGSGWALQALISACFVRYNLLTYYGHLGVIMLVGVAILIPGSLLASYAESFGLWLLLVSVLVSSGIMFRMHQKRLRIIGLPNWMHWSWFFGLQLTALASILYHFQPLPLF